MDDNIVKLAVIKFNIQKAKLLLSYSGVKVESYTDEELFNIALDFAKAFGLEFEVSKSLTLTKKGE